jgi:type VI secretion system secreted protein VgrG
MTDVFDRYAQLQGTFEFRLTRPLATRSYCRQSETDWNFVHRLMEDEGLYYYWTHDDREQKATFIVVDRIAALPDARPVGFYRGHARDEADGFTQWMAQRRLHSVSVASRSGDYRHPTSALEVEAGIKTTHYTEGGYRSSQEKPIPYPPLEDYSAGAYRYPDPDRGAAWVRIRTEEYESRSRRFFGTGGVRWIDAGARFVLNDHPAHAELDGKEREFVALGVRWAIQNNVPIARADAYFPYSLQTDIDGVASSLDAMSTAVHHHDGSAGIYAVEVEAQQTDLEFRSPFEHRKPVMSVEMATVVTPGREEVWTDELNRVKVRHHWDRHSPENTFNTSPALLVAQSDTGERYGAVHVPRKGETVYIDFVGGDCDRPYIVSRAPGGATPPMWHSHGLFSGVQSREYGGGGGYNEVQLDDATGQVRTRLLNSNGGNYSHLTLGYAIVQQGNTRGRYLGAGYVLHADESGSVRAGRGLSISTHPVRHDAEQMDVDDTRGQLRDAASLMVSQSSLSEQHRADSMAAGHDALTQFTDATRQSITPELKGGRTAGGGTGSANAFSQPVMLLGSPAGIGLSTQQSLQAAADQHVNVIAGQSVHVATGKSIIASAGERVSVFAQNVMKLFAKDKVQIESHRDNIELTAQKTIRMVSATDRIEIAADKEILITCGEAYIRLSGGGIEVHAPGKLDFRGSLHNFDGPASLPYPMPTMPDAVCVPCMEKRLEGRMAIVRTET